MIVNEKINKKIKGNIIFSNFVTYNYQQIIIAHKGFYPVVKFFIAV